MWDGDVTMDETWRPGASPAKRIRGRASDGPTKSHYIDVLVLRRRLGGGILVEASPTPDPINELKLFCRAQGAATQDEAITESATVTMQVIDQPSRGRVVVRGPGVPFLGPECRPAPEPVTGDQPLLPMRRVGILPPDPKRNWAPLGAITPWQMTIPRAEFAAGGTFRFRGAFSLAPTIEQYSGSDVHGTGLMHGKIAIDLSVRRRGKR